MRTTWARVGAATFAVAALGIAGCGDDGDTATTGGTEADAGASSGGGGIYGDGGGATETTAAGGGAAVEGDAITIAGFAFEPADLSVAAGSTITVTNGDGFLHTFTADESAFSERLDGGASVEVTMPDEPGTYAYHCEIHTSMTGTITVT